MTQVRIDARNLAAELDTALARLNQGDEVLLERDGQVVAQLAPCTSEAPGAAGSLRRYFEERLKQPPVGDWFADAVMEAVEAGNHPVEDDPWERS
jgi:antitoxin (DNA-binding transcriptional repressor) of toxin-antitoxin stability system